MAKDPAFLFYPGDFLHGVTFLDWADRGKYITILCHMQIHGRLTEESICFLVGSVSVSLKSKFLVDENNCWYNERLENEIFKRKKYSESRANNGKKGGRPQKDKESIQKPYGLAYENHIRNRNINENNIVENIGGYGGIDFESELLNSQKTIEAICNQNRISIQDAIFLRDCFVQQMQATQEHHNNLSDYLSHCVNWCRANTKLLKSDKPTSKIKTAHDAAIGALQIIKNQTDNK